MGQATRLTSIVYVESVMLAPALYNAHVLIYQKADPTLMRIFLKFTLQLLAMADECLEVLQTFSSCLSS